MNRTHCIWTLSSALLLSISGAAHAQGRGGAAWTTVGGDAQRSGAVRTDPRITKESAAKIQLLWKRQLESKTPQAITQPVLLPNIISYKGFKALAYLSGGGDTIYSIDYDLNRLFWQRQLNTAASGSTASACPAGLTAVTRPTPQAVGFPAAPGAAPAQAGRGRAGGPGGGGGGFGRGNSNVYAVSSGGMVHALNPQTGEDVNPPAKFVAANARLTGAVLIDDVLYAAATGNCGGVANGVYAIDLADNANTITSWDAKGAAIAGNVGPAFGPDGTIYVATGASSGDSSFANAVVALEARTLKPKDSFTASAPFTSSPIVFTAMGKVVVAASNADGSVHVLDTTSLGGSDHRVPLAKSPRYTKGGDASSGALTTWESDGTRMIAIAASGPVNTAAKFPSTNGSIGNGGVVAFKIADENGTLAAQPAWSSRNIVSPGAPIAVNGVIFGVSNGEYRPGARPSRSASVLYALDAATGKELWNSGNAIASSVPGVPPSAGDGTVYLVTSDGTLYAFGIPLEH